MSRAERRTRRERQRWIRERKQVREGEKTGDERHGGHLYERKCWMEGGRMEKDRIRVAGRMKEVERQTQGDKKRIRV